MRRGEVTPFRLHSGTEQWAVQQPPVEILVDSTVAGIVIPPSLLTFWGNPRLYPTNLVLRNLGYILKPPYTDRNGKTVSDNLPSYLMRLHKFDIDAEVVVELKLFWIYISYL